MTKDYKRHFQRQHPAITKDELKLLESGSGLFLRYNQDVPFPTLLNWKEVIANPYATRVENPEYP